MRRFLFCALVACHAAQSPVVTLEHVDCGGPQIAASLPATPKHGPLVFRVLRSVYRENDAGTPTDVSVTVQIEIDGRVLGPFTYGAPSCTLDDGERDAGVIAKLTCYYAGSGEYVDVRSRGHGDYALVYYGQSEGYADEPDPPRDGEQVVGTFHTDDANFETRLVPLDGGA